MTQDEIADLVHGFRKDVEARHRRPVVVAFRREEGVPVLVVYAKGKGKLRLKKRHGGLPVRVEELPEREMTTTRNWVTGDW